MFTSRLHFRQLQLRDEDVKAFITCFKESRLESLYKNIRSTKVEEVAAAECTVVGIRDNKARKRSLSEACLLGKLYTYYRGKEQMCFNK